MEFIAFSSLSISKLKLNYQVETGSGVLPFSSDNVIPICITFILSTLDLIFKYSLYYMYIYTKIKMEPDSYIDLSYVLSYIIYQNSRKLSILYIYIYI